MPLRERLPKYDTIAEFERSRFDRLRDSSVLQIGGRRHGAIYLLGYFVEITVKCAFFRVLGIRFDEPIRKQDIKAAAELVLDDFSIREPKEGYHNPLFWSLALIAVRERMGDPLPSELAFELVSRAQRLKSSWAPSMRYASDASLPEDWLEMDRDAKWLRAMYGELTSFDVP